MTSPIAWLENEYLRVGLSAETGALASLEDRQQHWNIIGRSELGLSFRLLVPLPDRRNNPVFGAEQDSPSVEVDAESIRFVWNRVRSRLGGEHPIGVTQRYVLRGKRLTIETSVDNQSEFTVENVFSPYLGDVRAPKEGESLSAIRHDYGSGMKQPMWPTFENSVGYYGVGVPTQLAQKKMSGYGTPVEPFTLIQGDSGGLYVGVEEPSTELVAWHAELWPGYGDSLEARVPDGDEISDKPVRLQFAAVHVPYIMPGQSRELTPVFLEAYAGDWHAGADVYARWRNEWLQPADVPEWAKEPHSWQQLQVNSPEDDLRIDFEELIEVGREAAHAGVTAIQLVGYNEGGQDRNNPSHKPDLRLGGYHGLKKAIGEIQAMGVKVVLFAKFNWADRSTTEFRERFIHEAVKDPYGDYYMHPGYKYETVTQLLDINTRRLIPMCFLSESYLQECERQFQLLLDLGADGILYDECLHHLPTLLCFDEGHGHRYGAPTYANDRELIHRFRRMLHGREDFLFAGEAIYDWEFDAYGLSYHRSEDRDHFPLHRYVAPYQQMMTAVTGFDDRNMVNQCLVYRYVISYEPFNFKGRLPDFPETVAYGQKMDALRRETREWIWDGRFSDTVGASVTDGDGRPHHPYSVFTHEDGSTAVVIANYDTTEKTVNVSLDGAKCALFARLVDGDGWHEFEGRQLVLPPRSAAVVLPRVPAAP